MERQKAKDYYEQALFSRLNDKQTGSVVSIQQRLHEDDPAAQLLEKGFEHLNLRAVRRDRRNNPDPTCDFSVCTTWGYREGKWHLLDVLANGSTAPTSAARFSSGCGNEARHPHASVVLSHRMTASDPYRYSVDPPDLDVVVLLTFTNLLRTCSLIKPRPSLVENLHDAGPQNVPR